MQVVLPAAEDASTIQMSTPVKRKKRRISASQVGRLSIIPKLDKSFTFTEDDFLVSSSPVRVCLVQQFIFILMLDI